MFDKALRADESAPTIIVAQAGNIHTGSFEAFAEICSLAHQAGAWVHVDGAFGLWVSASEPFQQFADLLRDQPGIMVLNDVVFNQVLVRFGDSDVVTQSVIAATQRDGTMWLGGSQWRNQLVARISVCNHATSAIDVERSAQALRASFDALALAGSWPPDVLS